MLFISDKKLEELIIGSVNTALGQKDLAGVKVIKLSERVAQLTEEASKKKEELEELRLQHKQEDIETKFLVKKKEEMMELDKQKSEVAIERKTALLEKNLQKEYFEKTISQLNEHKKEMQTMSEAILKRLPDISMEITKGTS